MAVSVTEAAGMVGISKSTAYSLVERGELPAVRITEKRLIIPVKALEEWLNKKIELKH